MKKKVIAIAVASALVAPSAYAATDTSGMRYTSASEGFYGSLRAVYDSGGSKGAGGQIGEGSSRIGVSGTADLGAGLTGFYGWELGVGLDDASGNSLLDQRLGNVGLRGDFGEIAAGSFWTFAYGATHGSTDQGNVHSGFFTYNDYREGRSERALQYTTPDFNGFQGALMFELKNDATANPGTTDTNDLDSWNIAGRYAVQGFTFGADYNVVADGHIVATDITGGNVTLGRKDAKSWNIRGSYAQDNWSINTWYGVDNFSDTNFVSGSSINSVVDDTTIWEIHAGISLEKVNLYAIHAMRDNTDQVNAMAVATGSGANPAQQNDSYSTLGVQYNLGSRSRAWLEYVTQEYDSAVDNEDYVNIGLRFDF